MHALHILIVWQQIETDVKVEHEGRNIGKTNAQMSTIKNPI